VESNICGATIKRNDAFGFGRALASKRWVSERKNNTVGHICCQIATEGVSSSEPTGKHCPKIPTNLLGNHELLPENLR